MYQYCLWVEYPYGKPIVFGPAPIEEIRRKLDAEGYTKVDYDTPVEVYDKGYSMGRIKATIVACQNLENFPTGVRY